MHCCYTILFVILALLSDNLQSSQIAFLQAIERCDIRTAKRLFATGNIALNHVDSQGLSPLSLACACSCTRKIVRWLILSGAPVNAQPNETLSPIVRAAYFGNVAIVELLLLAGADAQHPLSDGTTALHSAAGRGHVDLIRLLLEQPNVRIDQQNQNGNSPVVLAIQAGHLKATALLLEKGADIQQTVQEGTSLLHWAAQGGNPSVVRLLLDHGARTQRKSDLDGALPLHIAACYRCTNAIKVLLLADPRTVDTPMIAKWPGHRAIHLSAALGDTDSVELLLIRGADPNRQGYRGRSPLHEAACKGHTSVVKLLLTRPGILVDPLDNAGNSPIAFAAHNGDLGSVQTLLRQGSSIPEGQSWEQLPEQAKSCITRHLHLAQRWTKAAQAGTRTSVQALLRHGSSVPAGQAWDALSPQARRQINDNLHLAERWAETAYQGLVERYQGTDGEISSDLARFICSFATNITLPQR